MGVIVSQAKRKTKKKKTHKTFPKIKPPQYLPFLFSLIFSLLQAPVMEGRREGACGNRNSQNNPPIYRPGPPLTAIDRFLYGQNHFSQQQQTQNKQVLVSADNDFINPPFRGAIVQEAVSFVDGFFVDGEPLNWMHERNPNMGFKEEVKILVGNKNSKSLGKKAKKGSSEALIKGQWTDEEDR